MHVRKYPNGVRFYTDPDGPSGSGGGEGPKIDLNNPEVKSKVEELAKDAIEKFRAAEKKLIAAQQRHVEAAEKAEKRAAAPPRPQTTPPDPEEKGRRWVESTLAELQDDEDYTPQQAKKMVNLMRGVAGELMDAHRGELKKVQKAHDEKVAKLQHELKNYTNDPHRVYRDWQNQKPKLKAGDKELDLSEFPQDVQEEAVRLMAEEVDVNHPQLALDIAIGRKARGLLVDSEKRKLADAEAAEGLPVAGGGGAVELDPSDMPLPADIVGADLEDFIALADDK
jgi:hypothetical protein